MADLAGPGKVNPRVNDKIKNVVCPLFSCPLFSPLFSYFAGHVGETRICSFISARNQDVPSIPNGACGGSQDGHCEVDLKSGGVLVMKQLVHYAKAHIR